VKVYAVEDTIMMRRWDEVERELFPAGDEEKVQALEDQMRAEVRAYQLAEIRKART
jgi:hypothetical protein